jgi:hypothetical protein
VLHHHPLGFIDPDGALVDREPPGGRHAVRHARRARHEADVALGQEPQQPAGGVHDHERSDARALHELNRLFEAGVGRDRIRIRHHAVLGPLDDLDLTDLSLDLPGPEASIDDAEAAFLGLHNRHRRPGHRVHVRRDDRPLEDELRRQPGGQVDPARIAPRHHAELRREQKVVEGAPVDSAQELSRRHGA